jgi:hypothetical protein
MIAAAGKTKATQNLIRNTYPAAKRSHLSTRSDMFPKKAVDRIERDK